MINTLTLDWILKDRKDEKHIPYGEGAYTLLKGNKKWQREFSAVQWLGHHKFTAEGLGTKIP